MIGLYFWQSMSDVMLQISSIKRVPCLLLVVLHSWLSECGYRIRDQIREEREQSRERVSEYQVGKERTGHTMRIRSPGIGLGRRSSRSSCLRGRFCITKRLGNNDVVRDTRENETIVLLTTQTARTGRRRRLRESESRAGDGFNPTATTGLTAGRQAICRPWD
jgi:hypothetical protein